MNYGLRDFGLRISCGLIACVLALGSCSAIVFAQAGTVTKTKKVTVTLVRWPYT